MTTLVLEPAPATLGSPRDAVARPRQTLEALVAGTWNQLRVRGQATCPACGDRMETRLAPGRTGAIGHCSGCDTELS